MNFIDPTKKAALLRELLSRGFVIREDSHLIFIALCEVATVCGPRDVSVVVFPVQPDRVYTRYESEGRNVLESYNFPLSADLGEELGSCLKVVDGTYGRRLFLAGVRAA